MNVLVLSPKECVSVYKSVIEKVPNLSVIGSVTKVNHDFLSQLRNKYNPHIVVVDTSVASKNIDVSSLINAISNQYPYMKTLVLADEDDSIQYNAYKTLRGQISSTDIKELLVEMSSAVSANNQSNVMFDYKGEEPTEKLSQSSSVQSMEMDKLSTPITVKNRKKANSHTMKILIIIFGGISLVLILSIVLVFAIKLLNSGEKTLHNEPSASPTVAAEVPTTEKATEHETDVNQYEYPTIALLEPENEALKANSPTEEPTKQVEVPTEKQKEKTHSNDSDGGRTNDSAPSTSKSDYGNNQNPAQNDRDNSYSNEIRNDSGGDVSISYGSDTFNNAQSNEASSVKVSYSSKTLYVDDTLRLMATVYPPSANQNVSWTSSATSVVSVDSNGNLTARSPGNAYISATAHNGVSSGCSVTVYPKQVYDSVYLSATQFNLNVGEEVTVQLYGSSNCDWQLSSKGIVFAVNKGSNHIKIRAVKKGSTQLTARDINTNNTYSCGITVR